MKVMLVKPIDRIQHEAINRSRPQVGDRDVVVEQFTYNNRLYYVLEAYESDSGFAAENFATLPSTTEEIAVECEGESIVNPETAIA